MYPITPTFDVEIFLLHWDSDIGTTEDVWIALWTEYIPTGEMSFSFYADEVSMYHASDTCMGRRIRSLTKRRRLPPIKFIQNPPRRSPAFRAFEMTPSSFTSDAAART